MILSCRRTLLVAAVLTSAAFTPGASRAQPAQPTSPVPPTRADAAAGPEIVSTLRALVEGSPLASARTGILVAAVDTGDVIYARDADALLNPASNVKLVTSAAALARLGPEYRFTTEYLVDGPGRTAVKALYVRGRGDPSYVTERLWATAGELQQLGLRSIGELVLDDSYFDAERFGPGYDREDTDRAYSAPSGALSLNFNSVQVVVTPGDRARARARVQLEPMSRFFEVENRTVTVGRRGRAHVVVRTELRNGRERVIVEGRVPMGARPHVLWRRIDDPTLYFGHTLASLLELRGVKVGRIRAARVPDGARIVHVALSDALAEIVRRLNKTSNNFTAEQLLRTLGAEGRGAPGSWAKGVEVAEEFLSELGVPPGSYVMRNGSGLNDANRFSARQLVTVLRGMWTRAQLQPEFVVSLPVAARDGTIRWRMGGTAAAGRLRAKTGTLDGVVSLSGYVLDGAGRTLAFAVLVNDSPGRPGVVRAVDALGAALAASGAPPGTDVRLAVATIPPPADLGARLRTFYALAKGGDVRNEPLLRDALRETADPVARLALAECAYLADPESDSAQRALLEASAADPDALARLWTLLPDLSPGPVVSSLADLAADEEPEALRRLVDIAGRTIADERLAAAVAEALAGVAGSAPEQTVDALRAAPPPVAEAAAERLAAGLGADEDGDGQDLATALRAMVAKGDERADLAGRLLERLPKAKAAPGARAVPASAAQGGRRGAGAAAP